MKTVTLTHPIHGTFEIPEATVLKYTAAFEAAKPASVNPPECPEVLMQANRARDDEEHVQQVRRLSAITRAARVKLNWENSQPPLPGVYATRRGTATHESERYWDGERWWALSIESEKEVARKNIDHLVVRHGQWVYQPYRKINQGWRGERRPYVWVRKRISDDQQSGDKAILWGRRSKVFTDTMLVSAAIELGDLPPAFRETATVVLNALLPERWRPAK